MSRKPQAAARKATNLSDGKHWSYAPPLATAAAAPMATTSEATAVASGLFTSKTLITPYRLMAPGCSGAIPASLQRRLTCVRLRKRRRGGTRRRGAYPFLVISFLYSRRLPGRLWARVQ